MKVAVLTLTRDRLPYTQHCFARLRELAGCDFDHYVLDQGSTDGTGEWLLRSDVHLALLGETNRGIHAGLNLLLDNLRGPYDVVVKVDNDCELTVLGTLRAVAETHMAYPDSLVGPIVNGLRHPMPVGVTVQAQPPGLDHGYRVGRTDHIGGIMCPIPDGWRYDETLPVWGMDDTVLSARVRAQGGLVGQLLDHPINHHRTTDGQHDDYQWYFDRRISEGGPV